VWRIRDAATIPTDSSTWGLLPSSRSRRRCARRRTVAGAARDQIAVFFATDGVEAIDPDGPGLLFETPVMSPLPEDVVFFP
jgi:hypothetical protein